MPDVMIKNQLRLLKKLGCANAHSALLGKAADSSGFAVVAGISGSGMSTSLKSFLQRRVDAAPSGQAQQLNLQATK
jgi:type II secretory ATPase GspE/PulE/Tfp pilus assembly ATPase PilB-like protein